MAEHFLTKTSIAQDHLIRLNDTPVLDRHNALRDLLALHLGPDAAALFAVPLIGRDRSEAALGVSWYGDHPGSTRSLASLDGAIRDDVADRLAEAVAAIRALDVPPQDRALLDGALSVGGVEDVLVVAGRPILVNWGTAPPDAPVGPGGVRSNFAAAIGALLPAAAATGMTASSSTSAPYTATPPSTAAAAAHAAVPEAVASAQPLTPAQQDVGPRAWLPPLVLSVLLALVVIWLLIPGVRLFPARPAAVTQDMSDNATDVARRINDDLQARIASLQQALDGAVCTPNGDFLLPDGRTPEGLLPPPPATGDQQDALLQEGQDTPLLPPNPARIQAPPAPGGQEADSLLGLIEARTVLILASGGGEMGMGTGFFIAPDVVATNYHVIAGSLNGGQIAVVNAAWTGPRTAQVVQHDGPFEATGGDFALLRVADTPADQPYYNLLDMALPVKGQAVMAAGFPFDITGDDLRFQHLVNGQGNDVPDLVVTNGIVNSQQVIADTVSVLIHSASISKGNSGGPLVDQCGRVVGVNTFISEQSYRTLNVAQSMTNLRRFLERGSVRPESDSQPCVPSVAPAAAPPSPDAAADRAETEE